MPTDTNYLALASRLARMTWTEKQCAQQYAEQQRIADEAARQTLRRMAADNGGRPALHVVQS